MKMKTRLPSFSPLSPPSLPTPFVLHICTTRVQLYTTSLVQCKLFQLVRVHAVRARLHRPSLKCAGRVTRPKYAQVLPFRPQHDVVAVSKRGVVEAIFEFVLVCKCGQSFCVCLVSFEIEHHRSAICPLFCLLLLPTLASGRSQKHFLVLFLLHGFKFLNFRHARIAALYVVLLWEGSVIFIMAGVVGHSYHSRPLRSVLPSQ
mmetsp:Transcript_18288/g.45743  ORF Transcript_18288/g.45743 Transcript_18288/m.45743 type:complete len:203 (-) Transcript_18288:618-1226(-)